MVNITISTNLLIIISVLLFMLIVGCIAYIIYKDKKEDREEIDEIINDLAEARPREVAVNKIPVSNEEESEEKLDLENMLEKMQKDLEASKEEVVSNFETEQEEKAIISYKELIESSSKENFKKEVEQHEKEIEEMAKPQIEIKEVKKEEETKKGKFKNTDFISPVYGKMDDNLEYPTVKHFSKEDFKHAKKRETQKEDIYEKESNHLLEETLNIKPIKDEIKKNDEFLKALKEFRSNL